jgi:hypothetical protein
MMRSLPWRATPVRATERVLEAVYKAAYAGISDKRLPTVAGLDPMEYQRLYELDPQVREHYLRGRADSELEHALMLAQASREGDAKASLAILQHVHGWTAKQQIELSGDANVTLDLALDGLASNLLAKIRAPEPRVIEQEVPNALDCKNLPETPQQVPDAPAGEESRGAGECDPALGGGRRRRHRHGEQAAA